MQNVRMSDILMCMQQHRFSYNEAMPVESCTQALSDLALRFGEDDDEEGGMVRAGLPQTVSAHTLSNSCRHQTLQLLLTACFAYCGLQKHLLKVQRSGQCCVSLKYRCMLWATRAFS